MKKPKKPQLPKIDWPIVTEIIGVSLATYGVYTLNQAAAFIGLGTFLVWITEKN